MFDFIKRILRESMPSVEEPAEFRIPTMEEQETAAREEATDFLNRLFNNCPLDGSGKFETGLFRIAGITHYEARIGPIKGIIVRVEDPHDKNAIAIADFVGNQPKKHYGYIPKVDKKRCWKLLDGEQCCPYIGYVREFEDDNGDKGIMGNIKVYSLHPGKEMLESMTKDLQIINGVFEGYYGEDSLEELGDKIEWILDRHFGRAY